jgi:23S rRNA (adenine2030-N6)-methyltransferase
VLSYQHSYHAGNFADVHKHLALVILLRRLLQKDTPLCYVDSHAGRGAYDLTGTEARKTGEAENGILRLSDAAEMPPAVSDYLALVRSFNHGNGIETYPGSAAIAQTLLREQDRAVLLELHPQELPALRRCIGRDRRIAIHARDCHEGLPALLPPPIRRGLVLIDPSYELKNEFRDVASLVSRSLDRWANAVYLVWYPLLAAGQHRLLLDALAERAPPAMLNSEWQLDPRANGMRGSGLVVINTPWQSDLLLADAVGFVRGTLDPHDKGSHTLAWLTSP